MSGKPKYCSELVARWNEYFKSHISKVPKKRIYKQLSHDYGVPSESIRNYFERDSNRSRSRKWWKKNVEAPRKRKKRQREYRSRPKVKAYLTTYHRNNARLRRTPEKFLSKVFKETDEASLDYIRDEIPKYSEGIRFKTKTVEKAIKKYIDRIDSGTIRGPPIEEVRPGVYRKIPLE